MPAKQCSSAAAIAVHATDLPLGRSDGLLIPALGQFCCDIDGFDERHGIERYIGSCAAFALLSSHGRLSRLAAHGLDRPRLSERDRREHAIELVLLRLLQADRFQVVGEDVAHPAVELHGQVHGLLANLVVDVGQNLGQSLLHLIEGDHAGTEVAQTGNEQRCACRRDLGHV